MKEIKETGILLFLVLLSFFLVQTVSAGFLDNSSSQQILYDCGKLNTSFATYTLNQSIINSSTCFDIANDSITIDFAGFNITGDNSGSDYGVYSRYFNNSVIKNGYVYNFGAGGGGGGVYLRDNKNNTLINLTINSTWNAVTFSNSNSNNVSIISCNKSLTYGIMLSTSSNNTIKNSIFDANPTALWFGTSTNNTAVDNTLYSSTQWAVYLSSSANENNISNNNIWNCSSKGDYGCIYAGTDSNTFIENRINYSFTSAIKIEGSNNVFQDTNLTNIGGTSIIISSGTNNSFINFTYTNESVTSGAELIRKWYYQAYANYTNGTEINSANITAYNSSGFALFSVLTNSSGWISRQQIIDYRNNGTSKYFYSNYSINATKSSQADSEYYNATLEENKLIGSFSIAPPETATVSSSEEGSSGSSKDEFWISTTLVSDLDLKKGYVKSFSKRYRIMYLLNSTKHYVGLVDIADTKAVINSSSISQQRNMSFEEEWKVDVNSDGFYDIRIQVNNITINIVNMTIYSMNETVYQQDVTMIPADNETRNNFSNSGDKEWRISSWLIWLIVLLILIFLVVVILSISKKFF